MSKRDSLNTYLEEEIEVDGKICEIIYSCKPNHQIKDYIFIIPGNPGIAKYYIELLLLLKKELSNYSIIIIGYAGFTLKNRKVALTIEEEATHKKEVILNILNEIPEDSKINIIGHSVGGLVIRRIYPYLENLKYNFKFIYLFPFLQLDPKSMIHKFINAALKFSILYKLFYINYLVISIFPKFIKSLLFKSISKGMSEIGKEITFSYFFKVKHISYSVLKMAQSEFRLLDWENHFPEDFPFESSVFIYNSEDFWAPKYQGENIQKKYLSANFIFLEGSLHDFCVREEGNQTISLEIIKLLSN